MSEGKREHLHLVGLATMADMQAAIMGVIGAVLHGDGQEVEALRAKAHDLLDQHIDSKIEGVGAIREAVKREYDGR